MKATAIVVILGVTLGVGGRYVGVLAQRTSVGLVVKGCRSCGYWGQRRVHGGRWIG